MSTPDAGRRQGFRLALEARGFVACALCGTLTRARMHCGMPVAGKAPGCPKGSPSPTGSPLAAANRANAVAANRTPKGKGPNKSEAEYHRMFLAPRLANGELTGCWYEGLTFRMANGHRYTPDWVCRTASGAFICIEVKGLFRFGSHQRARLAFDQARIEWPNVEWRWAVRCKGGTWCT